MTLGIVLPKQAQTGPTRSNIEGVTWLQGSSSLSPHRLPAQADGNENRSGKMQMKSAKELKGGETISQGNELIDCKDGTSARPPGAQNAITQGQGQPPTLITSCCQTLLPWLQNSGPFWVPSCIFAIWVELPRIPPDLTDWENSKSWIFQERPYLMSLLSPTQFLKYYPSTEMLTACSVYVIQSWSSKSLTEEVLNFPDLLKIYIFFYQK